jgi:hypothetical protein
MKISKRQINHIALMQEILTKDVQPCKLLCMPIWSEEKGLFKWNITIITAVIIVDIGGP